MRYKFGIKELASKFIEFNQKYFNGSLPVPVFRVVKTKSRLGCFKYRSKEVNPYIIEISHFLDREEWEINRTLLHEMIHLWQRVEYGIGDHGRTFKSKAADIYKLSDGYYDIKRCSCIAPDTATTNVNKEKTLLVIFDYRGKRCYAKPSKGKGPYLLQAFRGHQTVKNMSLVEAYGDFSGVSSSVKRLNYKFITDEEKFNKEYKIKKIA